MTVIAPDTLGHGPPHAIVVHFHRDDRPASGAETDGHLFDLISGHGAVPLSRMFAEFQNRGKLAARFRHQGVAVPLRRSTSFWTSTSPWNSSGSISSQSSGSQIAASKPSLSPVGLKGTANVFVPFQAASPSSAASSAVSASTQPS